MSKYHVVMTCNEAGWDQYGRRCVSAFLRHWGAPLSVYTENFSLGSLAGANAIQAQDLMAIDWIRNFKDRYSDRELCVGKREPHARWAAVSWAHAVAATIDGCERHPGKIVIRLDADVFTHEDVTEQWLDGLFDQECALGLLMRSVESGCDYPEMGFGMFNTKHPALATIIQRWKALYVSGGILKLDGWTDAHALLASLVGMEPSRLICSLSGTGVSHPHPFINGPLGQRMDHMKGPRRKLAGKSDVSDLSKPRGEAYWNV